MNKNQKLIHKFLVKELKTLPHADLIEEGVLDRMGARVAGAWSKGISGDESRAIAKKVQRIINTHRVEMESDFAKLDITDTAAVEQVLDAMRKMENAAKQYLGGEKERSGGYVTKQGDVAPPIDTDGDGKPDAQDIDGDGEPEVFDTDGDGQIDSQDTDGDGKPDAKVQDKDGDGKPDVDAKAVNVYKGKGGKGLQSTLDKLKLEPAVRNAILKTVASQLKGQGVNVLEEEEDLDELAQGRQPAPRRQPHGSGARPQPPDIKMSSGLSGLKNKLQSAKNLEQYGQIYKKLAAKAGQPSGQFDAAMAELQAGAAPEKAMERISRFGDETAQTRIKFVELAKAEMPQAPAQKKAATAAPSSSGPKINLGGKDGVRWQLAKAGMRGSQLSQIVKAIQDWAKSSNLQINEGQLLQDVADELITENRYMQWKKIAGLLRS